MKIYRFLFTIILLSFSILSNTGLPQNNQKQLSFKQNKITADWNFLVYLVSNNDLEMFALQNINEMIQVGSNEHINILIQVDTYAKNESSRYFIKQDNPVLCEIQSDNNQSISGTKENLYGFVKWGTQNFPAKHTALIIWDHGSGIEDPHIFGKTTINYPHDIFTFNKKSGLIELNRKLVENRGIGFNEVFNTYLTNQDITKVIEKISKQLLNNKRIDILGMDACFMAMVEIASQIKDYVTFMVASQEVEPGTGWKYDKVLEPFCNKSLTPEAFSRQIVRSYRQAYQNTYTDYTLSSISLINHSNLEDNINKVAESLIFMINNRDEIKISSVLKRIRESSNLTTSFTNKNYIDLFHFYESLLDSCFMIEDNVHNKKIMRTLKKDLKDGLKILNSNIIKSVSCNKLANAKGLSIYFPNITIHDSYFKTEFAKNNNWKELIELYLNI